MPTADQDLNAVTTYTTTALAPGTYYFNIRAVDRGGNWSASYRSYGPVIIREPDPADLTWHQLATWDYPLVPRGTPDATAAEAHVSATLPGQRQQHLLEPARLQPGRSHAEQRFLLLAQRRRRLQERRLLGPDRRRRPLLRGQLGPGGGLRRPPQLHLPPRRHRPGLRGRRDQQRLGPSSSSGPRTP